MALDETTRQVNKRTVEALHTAYRGLHEASVGLMKAIEPMEELSNATLAHHAALEELQDLESRTRAAGQDVYRRWRAESEGER